ncbi:nitrite reductase small subunit NirD [Colwellia sp. RE-S-Sl-9]
MTIEKKWQTICHKDDLVKNSGVCALLENEEQIAIFQVKDQVFSVGNWDPIGEANVLYRGLIGDKKGDIYVASPLYKQRFVLNSGKCLDDENVAIKTYDTRLQNDEVQVLV